MELPGRSGFVGRPRSRSAGRGRRLSRGPAPWWSLHEIAGDTIILQPLWRFSNLRRTKYYDHVFIAISQNQYLAQGSDLVHAVMSVTAGSALPRCRTGRRSCPGPVRQTLVEALIVDCSGSMDGEKIMQTRQAVNKAIDLLHDDAWFCVIAGSARGKVLAPLTQATPREPPGRAEGGAAPGGVRRHGHVHLAANRAG